MNDHTDWADARLVKNVEDAANTLDGMYYLRARYYNPANSRMLSEDPDRSGLNWHTYCNNNPIIYVDPWGLAEVAARAYAEGKGATVTWTGNVTKNGVTYANATVSYNGKKISITGELKNGSLMIDQSAFAEFNWNSSSISAQLNDHDVGKNKLMVSGPVVEGEFKNGIFFGSGFARAGYAELNVRLQAKPENSIIDGMMIGAFAKASAVSAFGKVGIGNGDFSVSLKGVGDVLTATGQAGIAYKNEFGLLATATASLVSGRATVEFGVFDSEIELGVSGYAGGIGATAQAGYFKTQGYYAKAEALAGVGGGFHIRFKP
jgi:RHS repeat-associated protein